MEATASVAGDAAQIVVEEASVAVEGLQMERALAVPLAQLQSLPLSLTHGTLLLLPNQRTMYSPRPPRP